MTTLITGAGIIGCRIAEVLVGRGERPVLFDLQPNESNIRSLLASDSCDIVAGDVRDRSALDAVVERFGVDDVVHTAAILTPASRANPRLAAEVNICGSINIMDLARERKVRRVVLSSSTTVTYSSFATYADGSERIPEDYEMKVISQRPASFYAASKLAMEFFAALYREQQDADVVCVRYGAVLGSWGAEDVGFVSRMVSSLIAPALSGQESVITDPAHVWQGEEEFIDARDCASGTLAALESPTITQPVYTLSGGRGWSMEQFADVVRCVLPSLRVRYEVQAKGGFATFPLVRKAMSDLTAAARDLQWQPAHSLQQTIEHLVDVHRTRRMR